MGTETVVIFDGDDTLWFTESLYDMARRRVADYVEAVGLDPIAWDHAQRHLDLNRVRHLGFAWYRFPTSCALAVAAITPQPRTTRTVWRQVRAAFLALRVFRARPLLVPGASETLEKLQGSCQLVLLTKGQRWVQQVRIRQSGLRDMFAVTEIVKEKDASVFARLAAHHAGSGGYAISVGNSIASDIKPALAAGLGAVWIDRDVWAYERREEPTASVDLVEIYSLMDLPGAIESLLESRHSTSAISQRSA